MVGKKESKEAMISSREKSTSEKKQSSFPALNQSWHNACSVAHGIAKDVSLAG